MGLMYTKEYIRFVADLHHLVETDTPLTMNTFCSILLHSYGSFTDFKDHEFEYIADIIYYICSGNIYVAFEVFWYCIDKGTNPCKDNNKMLEYTIAHIEFKHSYLFMEYLLSKGATISSTIQWRTLFSLMIEGCVQKNVISLLNFLINDKHLISINWENDFLYECACNFKKNILKTWIKKQMINQ